MRRRKLKVWVKFLLIIIVLGISYFVYLNIRKNNYTIELNDNIKEDNQKDIVNELKNTLNLDKDFLAWIDKKYPDSLNKIYEYFVDNSYESSLWRMYTGYSLNTLNDLYNNVNLNIVDTASVGTINFVGDVSLADNWQIMPKYDERKEKIYGILSSEVVDILNNSNFLVVNSEFTVSNRGTPIKGKAYTFRAKPERLGIYYEMGVDLALLANNHVYDFGSDAFLDMLYYFKEYNIPAIGAGKNINEASMSYYVVINGYKFAFLNCTRAEKNILTPGATQDSEGVFRCYDTKNMINAIKEAKENSDYVIANVHFGKEGSHNLEDVQIKSAKEYIDAGADIVVGHHAHVLQGIEIYNDKPIIYNLGNFIFNKNTQDTAIFEVNVNEDGVLEYYIIPCIQKDEYTSLANNNDKERIIKDLNSWSINVFINKDGKIIKK